MKKTVTQGSTVNTTEYLNEFQYLNGTLQFIQHAEGYVKYTAGGSSGFYNYVYHIKDHLGNIRVSFTKQLTNNTAKLLKENHYYPFGLKHPYNSTEFDYYYNTSTSSLSIGPLTNSNRYQYNSKEWQNELSLNLYDYGARMFDPAIGRWGVVDPLAEKYQSWSPYNYVYNNPLKFVDPTGMGPEDWYRNNKTGEYVWKEGSGKQKGFTHIGLTRFSSIDNNLFYWRGENDVVAITNENSNRFRLLAIEGGIKESKYGLHIINASIQNRLDKNFEGAENFEDLLTYKQYNAINEPNYINFDKFLDDNYKFNGRKGNEFLEKVKDVLYSNSVDVLKSKYNMKEANLILGYSHNGQTLFGKYRYEITFDKKSTLITNVESSKNTFPDLK